MSAGLARVEEYLEEMSVILGYCLAIEVNTGWLLALLQKIAHRTN